MALSSPADLIAALSRLMRKFPAYSSYLRTSRDAVIGALSEDGTHGIILDALESGANCYDDLQTQTGFSASFLHRHLNQLIEAGLVESRNEPVRGNFRPRKLFFRTKNKVKPAKE